MANYNAPKWQGIKGVTIPELNDDVKTLEVQVESPEPPVNL